MNRTTMLQMEVQAPCVRYASLTLEAVAAITMRLALRGLSQDSVTATIEGLRRYVSGTARTLHQASMMENCYRYGILYTRRRTGTNSQGLNTYDLEVFIEQ